MVTPFIRIPAPRLMKFTILVDASLVIITIYSVCLILCRGVEKIFKKYVNFTFFYPKMNSPWSGVHKIYNFLSSYPKDGTYQIW